MHDQPHIRFTNAKQAKAIHEFKNIKRRLHKNTAVIWYNKNCRDQNLTPKYISIKIKGNNKQNSNTLKAATHFRINQEIIFLYFEKSKLNEQLCSKHLKCASTWSICWTAILEAIDSSLQAEMETYYNKLNKKLDNPQAAKHKRHKSENRNPQRTFHPCTINLTNISFTTEQELLNQGMRYSIQQPNRTAQPTDAIQHTATQQNCSTKGCNTAYSNPTELLNQGMRYSIQQPNTTQRTTLILETEQAIRTTRTQDPRRTPLHDC